MAATSTTPEVQLTKVSSEQYGGIEQVFYDELPGAEPPGDAQPPEESGLQSRPPVKGSVKKKTRQLAEKQCATRFSRRLANAQRRMVVPASGVTKSTEADKKMKVKRSVTRQASAVKPRVRLERLAKATK